MVTFLTSSYVITLSVTPIALVVLREKYPEYKRPFKLPFYNLISLIAFCICGLMMHWIGYQVLIKLTCIITLFVGIYSIILYKKRRSLIKTRIK